MVYLTVKQKCTFTATLVAASLATFITEVFTGVDFLQSWCSVLWTCSVTQHRALVSRWIAVSRKAIYLHLIINMSIGTGSVDLLAAKYGLI